jgi:hypothetical protein
MQFRIFAEQNFMSESLESVARALVTKPRI